MGSSQNVTFILIRVHGSPSIPSSALCSLLQAAVSVREPRLPKAYPLRNEFKVRHVHVRKIYLFP
ncbi:hypothetical protein CDL15_Pgr028595 [Punica granatum]|uniref:Uncharacterized protein n=1 Tax=Punica granatum TaxID=22663 RepID=A0A218VXD5_PUNGR|nr:hypothetical protein CDL15_Pgr028595 [Punica granatum]